MSKPKSKDEMRPEYDFAKLGPGVTGKYFRRATEGMNLVLLEPEVAEAFPDFKSVNRALRLLMDVAAANAPAAQRRTTRASKPRPAAALAKSKPRTAGSGR
jgi:hypothetical protein